MANGMVAGRLRQAAEAAVALHERILVQRPFRSPDQQGGAVTMWANLAGLWGIVDTAPPRHLWPCQSGNDVALWIACDYHDGIEPGQRAVLRDDTFTIAEVVCLHEHQPGMWLRLVRGERRPGRRGE